VSVTQSDNRARLRSLALHVDLKKTEVALTVAGQRVVFRENRQASGFELIAKNVD
jgi:hypothetical protein